MEETKPNESAYSAERTKVTGPDSLRSTTATAEPPVAERPADSPKQVENVPKAGFAEPAKTVETPSTVRRPGGEATLAGFGEFLKKTGPVWLIAAGAIFGLMAVVTIQKRMAESARIAREKQHEEAAATVTPDSLTARCGQPVEDLTKEMYPIVTRTMTYPGLENEKIVFAFSKTAEEKSEWVFLSMKDERGARSFDTPEAKIAGLPCLDTKK
ncbi:MAG TPA: hypothetical protein VJO16_06155 [Candidatus Acidoferrum sp.]|nr:hypothetical protein [Candidatus Acidoferrum sp.]